MKNVNRILVMFVIYGLILGGIIFGQPEKANAQEVQQTVQQAKDLSKEASEAIEKISEEKLFDGGVPAIVALTGKLGKALGIAGAGLTLIDFVIGLSKRDSPSADQLIFDSIERANSKLDGIDQKLDAKFDELKAAQRENAAYAEFYSSGKDIDSQYKRFMNDAKAPRIKGIMIPEYSSADSFLNGASAISNVCQGSVRGNSIYDLVAEAKNGSYVTLPALHLNIANKFYKAKTLATYQRYRASYLTELAKRTKEVERPGQTENQIAEIEKNPNYTSIPFRELRDFMIRGAKQQTENSILPLWTDCENAFKTALTKYTSPANVRASAKKAVENEFLTNNKDGIKPDLLPLLFTDDDPEENQSGKTLGYNVKRDGKIDPNLGGGQFTAKVGKKLEELFPGYGFAVVAFTQYDGMAFAKNQFTGNCSAVKPISWEDKNAVYYSNGNRLVWNNLSADGPLRKCASEKDQYYFNLVVIGFEAAKAQNTDVKSFVTGQSGSISFVMQTVDGMLGKSDTKALNLMPGFNPYPYISMNNFPGRILTFFSLPSFVSSSRRAGSYSYIYRSKFPEMVNFSEIQPGGKLFWVVSPEPFL